MFEFWIEEQGQVIHRQSLAEGLYVLGRTDQNEIPVPNPNISRQHLRLEVTLTSVTITDLGSTNGTKLNGQFLKPHQPAPWSPESAAQIGSLTLHLGTTDRRHVVTEESARRSSEAIVEASRQEVLSVISQQATPSVTTLSRQAVFAGTDPSCAIRLSGSDIAPHHCRIGRANGSVEVTNLDVNHPAQLADDALPVGQPTEWHLNETLRIGSATLHLAYSTAAAQSHRESALALDDTIKRSVLLRYLLPLGIVGGVIVLCLAGALFFASKSAGCGPFDFKCLLPGIFGGEQEQLTQNDGQATPTLAPWQTRAAEATRAQTIQFETATPKPTAEAAQCITLDAGTGWLDLPFPYEGTDPNFGGSAETFRRLSQRSRFGGRINSFFDHEFPVYPPLFGGREPEDLATTLVTFTGEKTIDGFSQDSDSADWYSGHSGIDFAPARAREATTPVLAAAAGRLLLAKIDGDGNHMVWLEHDPDGDGRYEYATYYFHLDPDSFFQAMLDTPEETPIAAGQRIGTMGTTGRSSGIHLHFEVRHDIDRDGRFSMFERVDPYGFFPSEQIAADPWAANVTWIDSRGDSYEHEGIQSEYLWIHPLVDVVDSGTECIQASDVNVKVDLYPVLGFAVVNPGFTYIARNQEGDVLRQGDPSLRRITILPQYLEGVDFDTISLEFLDPELDTWFTITEDKQIEPRPNGGFTFSATIRKTGRYVLVGRENVDRVPPATAILLSGDRLAGQSSAFDDSVLVTLNAQDRGLITSPIASVQYSLDCGQSWQEYSGPFEVTQNTPHSCGESDGQTQTIELDENDFLLLAISEDVENNTEQPPAQVRFRIE